MNSKRLVVIICLIALLVKFVIALSGCAREPMNQKDEIFVDMIGVEIPMNEGLELEPDRPQFYTQDDWVDFFVYNRTGYDLVFEDTGFGVQGFAFDEEETKWEKIHFGFTSGDESRLLKNGSRNSREILASFPTNWIDTQGYDEIRLLVIGYAKDTPVVKAYGAYADIKIVEGSKPNIVDVTSPSAP